MEENTKAIRLRTVFMGTSTFANAILSSLVEANYNIVAVYTQLGKKNEQNETISPELVAATAEKNKIPFFEATSFDEENIDKLKELKPDLIIVAAYGKILPKEVLETPGFGALNVHPSLLPKFRGPSPIQNALMEGNKETGTTIMLMDEGIDTGDILSQKKIEISDKETYPELLEKLSSLSSKLLLETLPLWIERKIEAAAQDNSQSTLCQLIERQDGKIIWDEDAESIYNRYRAFYSWPGIYAFWERNDFNLRLKFTAISILRQNPEIVHQIGEVFEIGDQIGVQTGQGIIIVEEVQLEGKKRTKIKDFLNGYPDFLGAILK